MVILLIIRLIELIIDSNESNFYCVGGNVRGNKGIPSHISSFPSAAVLYGSPLTNSLSVLYWFMQAHISLENRNNAVAVKD